MKTPLLLLVIPLLLAACDVHRAAAPADGGVAPDTHAGPGDGAALDAPPSPSCAGLSGFGAGKQVAAFFTRKALIDPGLRRAWLLSHRDNADGDLYELSIPSGKLTKRGAGYHDIAWLGTKGDILATRKEKGKSGIYALDRVRPGSGKPALIEKDICAYQTSADGRYLLHLQTCKDNMGSLHLQDSSSGLCTIVSKLASRWGFTMTPDAAVIAYREGFSKATGCKQGTGTLHLHHYKSGTKTKVATDVLSYGVRFTPNNQRLLLRQRVSCNPSKDRLLGANVASHSLDMLTEKQSYGFYGYFEEATGEWTTAVSPDSTRALVADLDMTFSKGSKLVSVRIDGKGEQVLATDLFNYQSVSAAMRVWAYTVDGRYVLYLTHVAHNVMGLAAAPSTGGKALPLSQALAGYGFALSRRGAQVAYLEGGYSGPNALWTADLNGKTKKNKIHSSAYTVSGMSWTGDGRGLIWVEQAPGPRLTLRYGARASAQPVNLGSWKISRFQGRRPYAQDGNGCLVLHNRQETGANGTYLRLLPR